MFLFYLSWLFLPSQPSLSATLNELRLVAADTLQGRPGRGSRILSLFVSVALAGDVTVDFSFPTVDGAAG